ncbi:putative Heavy metal-associated isoprenylated plant protein 5 [Cocos nucifera]|uniref:Putative Heavy metal-associated isoprenylated plant protein 5 n=1 Tax=Cocos nucifera TaxID=13894 RepID=A0A8K0IMU8_COCNU|nr:putative Heavy metal-associated isoprenylated plant protein 5 [Cocos nucifera]
MGEKEEKGDEKPKKGDGEKKGGGEEKKKEGGGGGGGGGGKKEEGPAGLCTELFPHRRLIFWESGDSGTGVEGVKADIATNKLTVLGKADPWKVKERVEAKTRKKVDIISPANPRKKDAGGDAKKPAGGDAKKPDGKKPKAPAPSTVVLKIRLHCEGCIQKIRKTIRKIKGVEEVSIDAPKDLVTVKGTMDVKSLPAILKEKLRRSVEIIQPKKDGGGGGGGGGGEKKEKGSDGSGGEKKEKGDGGGGEKKDGGKKDDGEKAAATPAAAAPMPEVNKMDYYGPYGYRIEMVHAPQLFSDENPNACSIM